MLLILYKPKGNIVNHKDLLVDDNEAEDYLQDFPGSICVNYSSVIGANNLSTKCFNGMFGNYKIRDWLVPRNNNNNFIILKHETINI